jgi:RND family efflux transporter MFP subunit
MTGLLKGIVTVRNNSKLGAGLAIALLIGLLPTTAWTQAPATVVRTAEAKLQEVQLHHRVTGSLRAVARGDVAALEEGRIIEITVREGAEVKKDDVIARVDARRLEAQRSELQATLRVAEAQIAQRTAELKQAKRDLARYERLVQTSAGTVEEYQHRETAVAVAESQLQTEERRLTEIKSQLELIEVRLDDVVVKAPYDGRVVSRHAEPGEWIRPGEPFVTLISAGRVEAWLDVPERFMPTLTADSAESIAVELRGSDQKFRSLAAKRVPEVHARNRTFPLVLTLDDEHGVLSPGMSVDAWLPIGESAERLTVPKDAVIRHGQTAFVYKAQPEKEGATAVQAPVTVEFETGGLAVVSSHGLAAGDRVVVEGNERLVPGMPVVVAESLPARDDARQAAKSEQARSGS